MSVEYFTPGVADAAPLAKMARLSFVETFGRLYATADLAAFLEQAYGPTGIVAELADPALRFRAVRAGERIVAYAKTSALTLPAPAPLPGAAELRQLYVLKPWQGHGIAAALMDWALAEARAVGAPEMYLSVFSNNDRAKRFYARYGFEEVGRYDFKVGSQIDDDRIWRVRL